MLLIGLLLSSIANTDIPDSEVTSNQSEVSNSSASATITITMYPSPNG